MASDGLRYARCRCCCYWSYGCHHRYSVDRRPHSNSARSATLRRRRSCDIRWILRASYLHLVPIAHEPWEG